MKKNKLIIASIGILLLLWIIPWSKLFGIVNSSKMEEIPTSLPTQAMQKVVALSIVFDDGHVAEYSKEVGEEKVTPFSILKEAADKKSLTLDTQQYDFGVFVKAINGEKSGADKSWIYFVNGQSGQIAADQYELKPGDKVEWKYVVPEGE